MAQPIEMVSYTDNKGNIKPIRFRVQFGEEPMKVIVIDRVITKEIEKFAENNMLVFKCQSVIDDVEKLFEIKYELGTCRWMLYKI